MAAELPPITSLDTYVNTRLTPEPEERAHAIGAILFADKTRLAVIQSATAIATPSVGVGGETYVDQLRVQYYDTPDDFHQSLFVEGAGRILQLDTYHNLQIAQVGLNNVQITSHPSLRERASVNMRISFIDPATHSDVTVNVDEKSVLRVFTGEEGGIAIFEGMDKPEETALVIDHVYDQKKYGSVFFFHPTEQTMDGFTSVVGLQQFLYSLNQTLRTQASTPFQEKVLTALEKDFQRGLLPFNSSVRQELFTTIVIAHARLAEQTGDRRYSDSLARHLPGLRSGIFADLTRIFDTQQSRQRLVNTTVDNIIFGSRIPVAQAANTEKSKKKERTDGVFRYLQTEKARALREGVDGNINLNNPVTHTYLNGLVDMMYEARTIDALHDVEALILEYFPDSKYHSEPATSYFRYATPAYGIGKNENNGRKYIYFHEEDNPRDRKSAMLLIREIQDIFNERKANLLAIATKDMK